MQFSIKTIGVLISLAMLQACSFTGDVVNEPIGSGALYTGRIYNDFLQKRGVVTFPGGQKLKLSTHNGNSHNRELRGDMTTSQGMKYLGLKLDGEGLRKPKRASWGSSVTAIYPNGLKLEGTFKKGKFVVKSGASLTLKIPSLGVKLIGENILLGASTDRVLDTDVANPSQKMPIAHIKSSKHRLNATFPINEWPVTTEVARKAKPGFYGFLKQDGSPWGSSLTLKKDGSLLVVSRDIWTNRVRFSAQLNPDKSVSKGPFMDGKKHGYFEDRLANGKLARGEYQQDLKSGWWHMVNTSDQVTSIAFFQQGHIKETFTLTGGLKACDISNLGDEIKYYAIENQCAGTLFSAESGNLVKNAVIKNDRLVSGEVFPVYKQALHGVVSNSIFQGVDYNKKGVVEYKGRLQAGKRDGEALCLYKQHMEPCSWVKGERVDAIYLIRQEEARIAKWNKDCQSNFNRASNEITRISQIESYECYVEDDDMEDIQFRMEREISSSCTQCGIEPMYDIKRKLSCLSKTREKSKKRQSQIAKNLKHLKTNSCASPQELTVLEEMKINSVKAYEGKVSAIKKVLRNYRTTGEEIMSARAQQRRVEQQQIAQYFNESMRASMNSIVSDLQSFTRDNQQRFDYIMQQYATKKYDRFKSPDSKAITQNSQLPATLFNPKTKARKSYDEILAETRNRCLQHAGNRWDSEKNSCVITIQWGGRACYDPSGKLCNTGETLTASNTQTHNASGGTVTSNASSITGNTSNTTGSNGGTNSPSTSTNSQNGVSNVSVTGSTSGSDSNQSSSSISTQDGSGSFNQSASIEQNSTAEISTEELDYFYDKDTALDLAKSDAITQASAVCRSRDMRLDRDSLYMTTSKCREIKSDWTKDQFKCTTKWNISCDP